MKLTKLIMAIPAACLLASCATSKQTETWRKAGGPDSIERLAAAGANLGFTAPSRDVAEKPMTRDGKPAQIMIQSKYIDLSTKKYTKHDVLSDPAFQMRIRNLAQTKGADLMTSPSLVTRNNQHAKIEVIREMKLKGAAFDEMLNLGATLEIKPAILTNGRIYLSGKCTVREVDSQEIAFGDSNTAVAVQSSDTYFDVVLKPGHTAQLILRDQDTPGQRIIFITADVIDASGQRAKIAR